MAGSPSLCLLHVGHVGGGGRVSVDEALIISHLEQGWVSPTGRGSRLTADIPAQGPLQ